MSSPSQIQLLSPDIVQLIISHVVGSSRQVFAGVLPNSNEHKELLKPLLWVSHNFRAIAYPIYCDHFKIELVGPAYHERSMYNPLICPCDPGYHMRSDLGYPAHHLAKEIIIELDEWTVYTGKALQTLTRAPYEGCAFPQVHSITFHFMMYKPTEDDTPNPPESEAEISALVEQIKKMAPVLNEIRVATKVYGRPPDETSDEFGSFVSQFYRLANRIEYGCSAEDSVPVVLQLDGIRDLVHINYTLDEAGQQFAQLARLNASTLQSLVALCGLDLGIADLIRKTPRSFMKYPCLHTLKLTECSTSKLWRRITFKGAVPFPKLRHLCFYLASPLCDDTLFRGNASTLEFLEFNLDKPTAYALYDLKVFTPGSHPKLKRVNIRLMDDSPHFNFKTTTELMRYILSIGSEVPVRSIDGNDPFAKLKLDLAPLSDHHNIQVLSLANSALDLWSVIDLVKSLPLLSDLRTMSPILGPIPTGISVTDLPAYVCANYSPMSERFRCWRIERYQFPNCNDIAKCVLLMALACPNFDYAASCLDACKVFMWKLEETIALDEFKPYESRLQRLMFDGWIERIE